MRIIQQNVICRKQLIDNFSIQRSVKFQLSYHCYIQKETHRVTSTISQFALKVNVDKTQLLKMNTTSNQPVLVSNWHMDEVDEFTHLGSKVTTNGNREKDTVIRIFKTNQAFRIPNPNWILKQLHLKAKLRIFKSNVLWKQVLEDD